MGGWWVYVVGARVGDVDLVKVGESRNPMQRTAQIRQLLMTAGVPVVRTLGVRRGRDRPWHARLWEHLGDDAAPLGRHVHELLYAATDVPDWHRPQRRHEVVFALAPTEWYVAHRVLPELRELIDDPEVLRGLDERALAEALAMAPPGGTVEWDDRPLPLYPDDEQGGT